EVVVDQYCRNHLLLANDLCLLPFLESVAKLPVAGIRLELHFIDSAEVGPIVSAYRQVLAAVYSGRSAEYSELIRDFVRRSPRPLGLVAYPRGVVGLRQSTLGEESCHELSRSGGDSPQKTGILDSVSVSLLHQADAAG